MGRAFLQSVDVERARTQPAETLLAADLPGAEEDRASRLPSRTIYGVEIDTEAAALAARLDEVFILYAEKAVPPLEEGSLDSLLFGDVLGHLVDPEAALGRYVRLLSPSGVVLCSLPNAQHHSVLAALLRGDFQYEAAGLLDASPLRFFS